MDLINALLCLSLVGLALTLWMRGAGVGNRLDNTVAATLCGVTALGLLALKAVCP